MPNSGAYPWGRTADGDTERHIRITALCPLCRYRHKGHWSGAAHRLNRDMTGCYGSPSYAREELVALS